MIARLSGILAESSFTSCVIDVNGVGYEAAIPLSTFDKLPSVGEQVCLRIHTHVREDAILLFGFASEEEKRLFLELINVSGVGAKLALNILSAMPVSAFCAAVAAGEIKVLSRISGIGKRTAERLIVELRDKLGKGLGGELEQAALPPGAVGAIADASLALEQLGFKRDAIDRVVKELASELRDEELDSEKLLRAAIQRLNF